MRSVSSKLLFLLDQKRVSNWKDPQYIPGHKKHSTWTSSRNSWEDFSNIMMFIYVSPIQLDGNALNWRLIKRANALVFCICAPTPLAPILVSCLCYFFCLFLYYKLVSLSGFSRVKRAEIGPNKDHNQKVLMSTNQLLSQIKSWPEKIKTYHKMWWNLVLCE